MLAAFVSGVGLAAGAPRAPAIGAGRRPAAPRSTRARTAVTMANSLNGMEIDGSIRPVKAYILVRIADVPEQTSSGLFLATTAGERPNYGYAVAVGPGNHFPSGVANPMRYKENDVVLYGKYGGQDVDYNGAKHCFVTQDEILATFTDGTYGADTCCPADDVVFIKKDLPPEETSAGIVLAATAAEKPNTGKVLAVGPGRLMENGELEPMGIAVGDSVMFGKYGGTEVKFDGDDFLMVRAGDLYGSW